MHSASDENKLKTCVTRMIDAISQCIEKLRNHNSGFETKPAHSSTTDNLNDKNDVPAIDHLNPRVNVFTLDKDENDLLTALTEDIEDILDGCLPLLTNICATSFNGYLHQYGYDGEEQKFARPLTKNMLAVMHYELKGLLASRAAFSAASAGEQTIVKQFIDEYPIMKDKPNFWGPTLLYTTAYTNQLELVKFLIEKARCEVDTRNGSHTNTDGSSSAHETRNPVLGSTALHAACANNYLRIVEYLVKDKNADYFAKNQANKTPLDYGEQHPDIRKFFQDYLVMGYSNASTDKLAKAPITFEDELQEDCIWEYKPLQEFEWQTFSKNDADILHRGLISGKSVADPIQFQTPQGRFNVSLATFLREDETNPKSARTQAWVRCRGSSVLNFHIEAFWQLMFTRYSKGTDNTASRGTGFINTRSYSNDAGIELNQWYTCDAKTNWILNNSMNIRRKIILIDTQVSGREEPLIYDLSLFTLASEDKSIFGYLRWIPRLITNDKRIKDRSYEVDNFKLRSGVEVLPSTKEKKIDTASKTSKPVKEEDARDAKFLVDHNNDDAGDDDDVATIRKKKVANTEKRLWSPREIAEKISSTTATSGTESHDSHSPVAKDIEPQKLPSFEASVDRPGARKEREESNEPSISRSTVGSSESDDNANRSKSEEAAPAKDHKIFTEEKDKANDWDEKITTRTNYRTKPPDAMEIYLLSKGQLVVQNLNSKQKLPDYYVDKIPKLFFNEDKTSYFIALTGVPAHHNVMEQILQKVSHLSSVTEQMKNDYKHELSKTAVSVIQILTKRIRPVSENLKHYTEYFLRILKDKKQQYAEQFDEYITDKSKLLTDRTITSDNFELQPELKKAMEQYEKSNSFTYELEKIKHEALDEFIEQQIYLPRQQFERKPTEESLKVLNDFIEEKKKEMKMDDDFKGLEVRPFKLISKLLQAISIYNRCFQLQLPLFESAPDLLKKIHENTIVTISTSTGSGKSTLLPALLIADGYDRVLVTQPRRLPCTAICERVNNTMTSETDKETIAGWAVSGAEQDTNAPILYLTDGLLKEQLLHDDFLITEKTKVDKGIVFFLDEVHERSINIDLCLALLARLLSRKPQLKSKMKLIISSATLDTSVPTLFRQINQMKFSEFQMPKLGTLYPVTKHRRPNDNVLALVQELNKQRDRNDQILCFVSSVADVNMSCRLLQELSSGSIVAYPLVQAQSSSEQQKFIEQGSIFFSTTVAETSLTFPALRYVIDTGMINLPVYDFKTHQTVLKEVRAAESTIKQRLGRLGRTQPGDYYALYDFDVGEKKFPTPQICQSELSNIELSLRTAPSQEGLNQIKQYLPDKPADEAINMALTRLRRFNIITPSPDERFTKEGAGIAKLPDFGSIEMSKAVYAALTRYRCGHDLIVIASVLGVLNTSAVLTSIPNKLKSPDGDFMSLLNVMNTVLDAKKSIPLQHFKLRQFCQQNNLSGAYQTLNQACRRYETLEKTFSISKEFRTQAQVRSGQWELIAKALLKGYSDNVFVSLKELQGRNHRFTRYQSSKSDIDVAILDKQSALNRSIGTEPVSLVVARDIRYATSIRAKAILSFVGEIKATWIEYEVERVVSLNADEKKRLETENVLPTVTQKFPDIEFQMKNNSVSISGPSGSVLNGELFILQKLVEDMKFSSTTNMNRNTEEYQALQRNMEGIIKMIKVFKPMKWRWENEEQVKITLDEGPDSRLDVTVRGRNSKNRLVQKEFLTTFHWIRNCAVLRTPNSDLPPRLLKPQVRHKYHDMEEKIAHVTDSKRTTIDLWNGLQGPEATRETRMEVVAWITICQFGCKLEGGFVRDWIVGNYTARPKDDAGYPSKWISYRVNSDDLPIPSINPEVVPTDLDCHLPVYAYFDIDKFLDFMYKYQIECQVFREQWRYILLFDENTKTGPFTMDLIEPHVALTHDRIDFDVNNLLVEKDYTKELGMRVDIEQPPYSIDLETIVDRIRQKKLQILRPLDDILQQRIDKMVNRRGWTVINPSLHVIPRPPGKHRVVVVPLPPTSDLYKEMVKQIGAIPNAQVLKVEQIRNPGLEELYLGMKKLIQSQCEDRNVNERKLFHGTGGSGIDGIRDYGYDDRFTGGNTAKGDWGHGAYFADNTQHHAHGHAPPNEENQTRVMYYNRVLLGNIFVMREINRELQSAPLGHHSIHGIHPEAPGQDEFIVYRYGQALPYLKITYRV